MELSDLFQNMIAELQKRIDLTGVILFGSQAKGSARPDSDYDVLVVGQFKEKFLDRGRWVVQLTPRVPIDIFCYTPDEFEDMFKTYHLTAMDAIGQGIPLYGEEFFNTYKSRYEEFVRQGLKRLKFALIPPGVQI